MANPDEGKPDCCAVRNKVTPMHMCPSEEDGSGYVNVSKQFKLFFQIMLILNATILGTTLLSCLGDWCKSCRYIGGFLTLLLESVAAIFIVIGTFWRFSHEGMVCSG